MYVQRVKCDCIAIFFTIEKYLDCCVKILSPIPWSFFFFFSFSFFNQIVIMFKGTKDSCSASYGDKKPISKRPPARFTSS